MSNPATMRPHEWEPEGRYEWETTPPGYTWKCKRCGARGILWKDLAGAGQPETVLVDGSNEDLVERLADAGHDITNCDVVLLQSVYEWVKAGNPVEVVIRRFGHLVPDIERIYQELTIKLVLDE